MNAALLDYGAGNLHSLGKALERGGAQVTVTSDWDEALSSDALVLPGVGSFGAAVAALGQEGPRVRNALERGLPCLAICLGMQLLFDWSEESDGKGIGLIPGRVRKVRADRIPQMGWNEVDSALDPVFQGATPLVAYYANSYVCEPRDRATVIAWSRYDRDLFPAAVRLGACWGFQFHPEKSSASGLRIVRNFVELADSGSRRGPEWKDDATVRGGGRS